MKTLMMYGGCGVLCVHALAAHALTFGKVMPWEVTANEKPGRNCKLISVAK